MQRIEQISVNCSDQKLAEIIKTAARAALTAGKIIKDLYEGPFKVRNKGVIDLVTEADEAAERAIIAELQSSGIQARIIAEESSADYAKIPNEPTWVIDPLDGTTNFAHGFPWFCTSIAYTEGGRSLAGVIYCPMLDELFYAGHGCGAWLNNTRIKISNTASLHKALTATGFPYDIHQESTPVLAALAAVLTKCQGIRRAGAAALDLAYVACGRLDGFWEIKLKPWDTAAGQLLVTEAGGTITCLNGTPYNPYIPEVLASNGLIHSELLAILKDFSAK